MQADTQIIHAYVFVFHVLAGTFYPSTGDVTILAWLSSTALQADKQTIHADAFVLMLSQAPSTPALA
jgi:hypothetical protein